MWVMGKPREVWDTVQAMGRLGVGIEVDSMGTRIDTRSGRRVEIWSVVVQDQRLAGEFYRALTEG